MDDQLLAQVGDLKRLAEAADFKTLTAAEESLLEKVVRGDWAVCGTNSDDKDTRNNPENADGWGIERQIGARLLVWLCTDEKARKHVRGRGIQVYGADINESLDLVSLNISVPLRLQHCRLKGGLDLSGAEMSEPRPRG